MNSINTVTGYMIGLDLGDKRDFTALSVLRQHSVPTGRTKPQYAGFSMSRGDIYESVPEYEYQYDVILLDRWRGRGYRACVPAVDKVLDMLRHETHRQRLEVGNLDTTDVPVWVLVDGTGVGVAIVDDLRSAGLECISVTITGGDAVHGSGDAYSVPKRELVSSLRVLVENKRLNLAELPLSPVLESEMQNFRAATKLTTGHDSYGAGADWREGNHDDLVLSVAMASGYGEKVNPARSQAQYQALADAWASELT